MVETKTPKYWDELAQKGENENKLLIEIETLRKEFTERSSSDIFSSGDSQEKILFTDEFTSELHQSLGSILSKYPNFTPTELDNKRTHYFEQIYSFLHTAHIKKVTCEITFDAYSLLKLFKALDKIISEAQFIIKPEGIFIEIMDPSRICSIQIILKESSYKYFKKGKYALNIENLTKVLSCEANDKSSITLKFSDENLFITIESEKFGSEINRTANYLDLELEPIPLENLINIKYPIQFSLEQFRFIYTMKNLGVYSEIVNITADNKSGRKSVIFNESGDNGTGEVIWEKKNLSQLQFFHDLIKTEIEDIKDSNNEEYKENLEAILKEQQCTSAHSLTFLKWIEEIAKVLERKDPINFSIKDDHPLRITIDFKKLGSTTLLYYLAPRALKNEDEEDDFDDF
jgi:hypothetical protein